MALSTLNPKSSLFAIVRQIGFTFGMLKAEPLTEQLVSPWQSAHLEGLELLRAEALLEVQEAVAQGRVARADREIDKFVVAFDKALLITVGNNREAPEYKAFMGSKRPSEIKKYVLGPELETVRGWLTLLQKMTNPAFQSYASELQGLIATADEAVKVRAAAWQATNEFRTVGARMAYIDKMNALRKSTYGQLGETQHKVVGLPSNFADQFFMHDERGSVEPTLETVSSTIEGLTAELKAQQLLLAELQKQAAETDAQKKERILAESELLEAEKAAAEAAKKVQAIRARLK